MNIFTRRLAHGFIFLLGLVLIIAGVATQTKGALVIGLIVAAVNYRHYRFIENHKYKESNQPNS